MLGDDLHNYLTNFGLRVRGSEIPNVEFKVVGTEGKESYFPYRRFSLLVKLYLRKFKSKMNRFVIDCQTFTNDMTLLEIEYSDSNRPNEELEKKIKDLAAPIEELIDKIQRRIESSF